MTTQKASLFAREDTMLGICQGLGEDLGFHPNYLRIALGLGLFLSPVGTVAAYAALGVLVFGSRLLFPSRRAESAETEQVSAVTPVAGNDSVSIEYKHAA